jgi:hypothetical protein
MNNANDNGERKVVSSLREMPRSIAPPRDLWAGIEASIAADRQVKAPAPRQFTRLRWLAAAAVIAALAVGMWIGRSLLPTMRPIANPGNEQVAKTEPASPKLIDEPTALQAAYVSDPKYRAQRAALVKSLEAKVAALPPDSRAKVMSSLEAIRKAKQDLEAALGKDPSNALLQELLVNTYQDEMRVLTTVHEASDSGRGI